MFASEQFLCELGIPPDKIAAGIVRGERDGALGSVYVFLGGKLLSWDSRELKDGYAPGNIASGTQLTLHVIRSDTQAVFTEEVLDAALQSLPRLLMINQKDVDLEKDYSPEVVYRTGIFRLALQRFATRNLRIEVIFQYVARGSSSGIDANIVSKAQELEKKLSDVFIDAKGTVLFIGEAELWKQTISRSSKPQRDLTSLLRRLRKREITLSSTANGEGTKHEAPRIRFLAWLLFGAILGLLPLYIQLFRNLIDLDHFDVGPVLKGGELFVVSSVLAAGALGEVIAAARHRTTITSLVSGFVCLVCALGDSIAYALADTASFGGIVRISIFLFPASLIVSGVCIWVAISE
jgi:hypothetical protein